MGVKHRSECMTCNLQFLIPSAVSSNSISIKVCPRHFIYCALELGSRRASDKGFLYKDYNKLATGVPCTPIPKAIVIGTIYSYSYTYRENRDCLAKKYLFFKMPVFPGSPKYAEDIQSIP